MLGGLACAGSWSSKAKRSFVIRCLFTLRRKVTGEMFFAVPRTSSPTQVLANASPFTLTTISISARLAGCWRLVLIGRGTRGNWE